ncbi:hypothetical protein GCM10029976_098290 [Kribbella albertanoniae]
MTVLGAWVGPRACLGPAAAVGWWWVLVVDLGVVEIYGGPVVGLVLVPQGSKLLGAWASS